jgi:hypothetical protein
MKWPDIHCTQIGVLFDESLQSVLIPSHRLGRIDSFAPNRKRINDRSERAKSKLLIGGLREQLLVLLKRFSEPKLIC